MKDANAPLAKKLSQYVALIAPVITLAASAEAQQLVYTNIEPDLALNASAGGVPFGLDLNNDGHVDFRLVAVKSDSAKLLGVMVFPYTSGNLNAIAGTYGLVGNTVVGYPYALAPDQLVSDDLQFLDFNLLADSYGHFAFAAMVSTFEYQSYGNWKGGKTDHFLGLKFSPDGINTCFGWARCNVDSLNNSITIKDYAYDTLPNTPIFTGDGIQLGTGDVHAPSSFTIFSYEGVVHISVNAGPFEGSMISVTNMMGKILLTQKMKDRFARIDLHEFAKGIYLVMLQRGEEVFTQKISIR